MASDWIPHADDDFQTFFNTFSAWCNSHGATRGLTAGEVTALADGYSDWNADWTAHLAAQTAAAAATQAKDTTRTNAEPLIRSAAQKIQAHSATTNAERAAAGLTVRSDTRTRAAVPTTRPVLMIDNSQRLQQTVNFRDEATPNSKKKPDGVMGCEIRCYVGDTPPADPEDYEFCGLDTATPYLMVHDASEAKKNAYAVGRWVNTRGEKGPWSESVMATISA